MYKGFTASRNNYLLSTKTIVGSLTVIIVYFDEIRLAGDDLTTLSNLMALMDTQLRIKNLGHLHYFVRLEISSTPVSYTVCQHKYTTDLLLEFDEW